MYRDNPLPDLEPEKPRFPFFGRKKDREDLRAEDIYQGHDLKGFFISLKLHFSQLLSVNILMVLGNFPLFFAILGLSSVFRVPYMAPQNDLFSVLGGLLLQDAGGSALSQTLYMLFAVPIENSVLSLGNYICFGLSALTLFTFGLVNVGTTYLLRELVRGEPVFIWGDFWQAVKRNGKPAFFYGIFDLLMLLIIPFNLYFFITQEGVLMAIGFGCMLIIGLFYLFMRFYIYLQMVTFDLSIKKILKNSLIFSLLNLKRNFVAFLGIVLICVLDLLMLATAVTLPFAIAAPLVLLFALGSYMAMYAAYFKVEEVMVAPHPEENGDTDEDASDDGDTAE